MKTRLVWILLLVLLVAGCSERLPERVVNRELTTEEMAIPPGRYQEDYGMPWTQRVDLDSPSVKPTLEWVFDDENIDRTNALIDSEGGIWILPIYTDSYSQNSVIRLNPDGTKDWERQLLPSGDPINNDRVRSDSVKSTTYHLSFICISEGAAVLKASKININLNLDSENYLSGYEFAECLDLAGNTVWRSEATGISNEIIKRTFRIPNNRIQFSQNEVGFQVHSLADGDLIETIAVSSNDGDGLFRVINFLDDGWLIQGNTEYTEYDQYEPFSRISTDGSVVWSTEVNTMFFELRNIPSNSNILACFENGLHYIDSSTGFDNIIYETPDEDLLFPVGETPDRNFITVYSDHIFDDDNLSLQKISPAGEVLWSHELLDLIPMPQSIIIYRDGAIIVGDSNGISLFEPDGNIRWMISLSDLNINTYDWEPGYSLIWGLHPTSDGGLVVEGHKLTGNIGDFPDIFYFTPSQ